MRIENKDISLIIPTINRPGNVDRLLGTLQDFGYLNRLGFKPVVVDSSMDKLTKDVAKKYFVDYIPAIGMGKSKAMNFAIKQITCEYIAFLDDDIIITNTNWLDNLMSNFTDNNVAYVSGRVIAANTGNEAAKKWEDKGALNKGSRRIEVGNKFFNKFRLKGVPVNLVTMGANHVVRREIINEIGAHDEKFGPGELIEGAGADLDLTYKILKNGYSIVYDPNAIVAHHHPDSLKELRSKLFLYGISDTAIHMKFLIEFKDIRSLFQLIYRPAQNLWRMFKSLLGKYPLSADMLMAGIIGNLIGPIKYIKYKNYFNKSK